VTSEKERQAKRDDRLALIALLVGVGGAFAGRQIVIELAGGVALALGGALAAMRGDRPLSHRWLLSLGLVAAAFGFVCAHALVVYQEWVAGQWLAEGAPHGQQGDELRTLARALVITRIAALAGGLSFFFGALVDRLFRK
jgi:hypothetical protein